MNVLTELVRNIILIILLTTFLEMIMPSNNMQRFIKVVMGLFILIAILNPILLLINQQENLAAFVWQEEESLKFKSILEQEERLQKTNQDLLRANYRDTIKCQIESMVKLIRGVEEAQVQVKLAELGTRENEVLFEEIIVTVLLFEEQSADVLNNEAQLIKIDITKMLCHYWGLQEKQIKIDFI